MMLIHNTIMNNIYQSPMIASLFIGEVWSISIVYFMSSRNLMQELEFSWRWRTSYYEALLITNLSPCNLHNMSTTGIYKKKLTVVKLLVSPFRK